MISKPCRSISGSSQRAGAAREYCLVRQDLPVGEAIETLLLIWEASEADEWVNRLCLVPSLVTIAVGASAWVLLRSITNPHWSATP
jgi:hypothetical protein